MENYCSNSPWRICSERIAPLVKGLMVAGGNRLSRTEAAAENRNRCVENADFGGIPRGSASGCARYSAIFRYLKLILTLSALSTFSFGVYTYNSANRSA